VITLTTAGDQGEVLTRDGEPEIVQVDMVPFAAMTPVIVTHRFFGRSIADLVMDIQRIKTALIRSILDNAYLAVNPRVEVSEGRVAGVEPVPPLGGFGAADPGAASTVIPTGGSNGVIQ
jgi:hypothetical protein